MLEDGAVVMTRVVSRVQEEPQRMMGRLLLKCSIRGESALIYVDFKDPVPISEFPRMTVECPEGLFDSMRGEVWEGSVDADPLEDSNLAESVDLIKEAEEDEDEDE